MPVGRPKIYNNVEDMKKDINSYFKECDKKNRPYTMSGLAYALNMSRQSLVNYANQDEYFDTIKNARQKVEQQLEENLYRLGNNSGIIFNLKNNFGWRDKLEVQSESLDKVNELLSKIEEGVNND